MGGELIKERCGLLIVHSYSYVETGGVSPLNQSRSNTSCNVIISVTFSVCSFMSITLFRQERIRTSATIEQERVTT